MSSQVDDHCSVGLAGKVLADLGDLAVADQDVPCRVVRTAGSTPLAQAGARDGWPAEFLEVARATGSD